MDLVDNYPWLCKRKWLPILHYVRESDYLSLYSPQEPDRESWKIVIILHIWNNDKILGVIIFLHGLQRDALLILKVNDTITQLPLTQVVKMNSQNRVISLYSQACAKALKHFRKEEYRFVFSSTHLNCQTK